MALGLDAPLGGEAEGATGPAARTEAYRRASHFPPTRSMRAAWRKQNHSLVRTVSFTGEDAGKLALSYGGFELQVRDAMLDRAFECWMHAEDIADAVDYPYEPPAPNHLYRMIDLKVRLLSTKLAARHSGGPVNRPRRLVAAGAPGRSLRLEIEGAGGGEWFIPLDSPAGVGSAEHEVAHIAVGSVEFSRLAAGHVSSDEAAADQDGDSEAIREVLSTTASLSRMYSLRRDNGPGALDSGQKP